VVNCVLTDWGAWWLAEIWKSVGESQTRIHNSCKLLWTCWECSWQGSTLGWHSGKITDTQCIV